MKILLSHCYIWPDTAPYAFLLRAATIVRAFNVFQYTLRLFFKILPLRSDVVTASTFVRFFADNLSSPGAKILGARDWFTIGGGER